MQSSAPGTGRRAKNLSRYEVEPLRRVVGEPEADESLVVFVMVHVRVLEPAVVRDVEGPPIVRLDRAGDRSEPIADERSSVIRVFRSGGAGRVEDLLRLPLHVPGGLPVARLRREMDVRPAFVVGGDPFHRPDHAVADDQSSDVDAGIRDVLLEANDLAEELQRVDDRSGLLEALHPHDADPLRPGEDLEDRGIADEMGRFHEVRSGREQDAPRDRDARLPQRLQGEELVPGGDEAVAGQRRHEAYQLELAEEHLPEVRHRSTDAWDDDVLVAEGGAGKGRVVRAGDDEPDLVRLDQGRFMPVLLDRFEEGLRRPVARPLRNHADLHRSFPTAGPRERARGRKTCRARITRLTIYRRSPLGRRKGMGPVHSDTMREPKVDKRATIPVVEEVT